MAFGGNPNKTITAINTSGGIAASRTSGQTPCFVHVSASAITATGTSKPYNDLEFSWDFGDPSGAETFTQPINAAGNKYEATNVNANSAQTGPEAAYCYRTAGTKTITLTIRGQNGAGFTTEEVTQDITVSAFNPSGGEWWFDSAAGGGGSGSIGSPFNDLATLNTKAAIANTAIHVKRGSSWTGSTGITIGATPLRIDAYGSGAKPTFALTSGTDANLLMTNAAARSDVVVSQIEFTASGSAASSVGMVSLRAVDNTTTAISHIYLDNCSVASAVAASVPMLFMQFRDDSDTETTTGGGLWGCAISNTVSQGHNVYSLPRRWGFLVGTSFSGPGDNGTLSHYVYTQTQTHLLCRYNSFAAATTRNFALNINFNNHNGDASLQYGEWVLVSDNDFAGPDKGHDAGSGSNNVANSRFRNWISQRNAFHALTGNGPIRSSISEELTIRDNLVWGNTGDGFLTPTAELATTLIVSYYRNKNYVVSSTSAGSDTGVLNFNEATFTAAQVITDNVIQDQRANANIAQLSFTDQASALIDRNQYYSPNDSTPFWDTATPKSFAQWQVAGFDPNGSEANPDWIAPAGGDFSEDGNISGSLYTDPSTFHASTVTRPGSGFLFRV